MSQVISTFSGDGTASLIYFDRLFKQTAIKLLPGEYFVSEQGQLLVTVLGSCVSACIRDRHRRVGGMNHFMLPNLELNNTHLFGASMRFGVNAMEVLINDLLRQGSQRENLEAKIFGGANMMTASGMKIGQKNAQFVQEYLKIEKIPVLAKDLLGSHARKVYFFPESGKVMVHTLRMEMTTKIMDSEQKYSLRFNQSLPSDGGSELF